MIFQDALGNWVQSSNEHSDEKFFEGLKLKQQKESSTIGPLGGLFIWGDQKKHIDSMISKDPALKLAKLFIKLNRNKSDMLTTNELKMDPKTFAYLNDEPYVFMTTDALILEKYFKMRQQTLYRINSQMFDPEKDNWAIVDGINAATSAMVEDDSTEKIGLLIQSACFMMQEIDRIRRDVNDKEKTINKGT